MLPEKPHKRYPIVTVIGSTKFDNDIKKWAWEQTKKGYLILFAPFAKEEHITDKEDFENYRFLLEELHFQKMELSDYIFVFNKGDYIGTQTANELKYARDILNVQIRYLEPSVKCYHEIEDRIIKEDSFSKHVKICSKCDKILLILK